MTRLILTLAFLNFLSMSFAQANTVQIDKAYRQFLNAYCTQCHSGKTAEGKLPLDEQGFSFEIETVQDADKWQKILGAINSKEMPPEDEKQPEPSHKADFLGMLSNKMVEARGLFRDTGGIALMRRLNRREYENTMKRILGVTVDTSNLPKDSSSFGFDTDGSSLFMSSDQIEQYLGIAKKGLQNVLSQSGGVKTKIERIEPESKNKQLLEAANQYKDKYERALAFDKSKDPNKKPDDYGLRDVRDSLTAKRSFGKHYSPIMRYLNTPLSETGFLVWTGRRTEELRFRLSDKGIYKIRARVGKTEDATDVRCFLDFVIFELSLGSFTRLESFHITTAVDDAQIIEATVEVQGDTEFAFKEKVSKNASLSLRKAVGEGRTSKAALWIDWVELEGPLLYEKPPLIEKISKQLSPGVEDKTVQALLAEFAKQAFRGDEVSSAYLDGLFQVYRTETASKKPLEAIVEPLAMILASPGFIYVSELSDKTINRLSQREIAVRLAYFLWSGPPDGELSSLAEQGQLEDDGVLRSQIDRMLADKKAVNFYKDFTYQWLGMERLSFFEFNAVLFPRFDSTLKAVATEEVYQTFKTIVDEDLSTENLLQSDFVVINGMLAVHYGIPDVTGNHFRKVKLDKDSRRGGLTGMAAILAMGSDGNRTSPVERGAWVLRKILNDPPPPAPPNVPQLGEVEGENLTARQILKAHQEEPQCAHCHKKIDPIGFGLENFGPTGKWRTAEAVNATTLAKGKNGRVSLTKKEREALADVTESKIDASGSIYNGPEFKDYLQLRDIFLSKSDDFNRGLIESMLGYSLGRTTWFSDRDLIGQIQADMAKNNNSMRSLIHAIVKSEAFKTKKQGVPNE